MWGHRAKDRPTLKRANPTPVLMVVAVAASVGLAAIAASPGAARTMTRRGRLTPRVTTSTPIALDLPGNGAAPLIAYSPSDGYTYVAWNAPNDGGIDLCVLLPSATSCEGGGAVALTDPLLPGNEAPVIGGLTVLTDGDVVVLGATGEAGIGTLAWESPAGGASFLAAGGGLQNAGNPVSPVSLYYSINNAVGLNGTDVALDDNYFGDFSDSPFAGPKTPATLTSPNANATGGVQNAAFQRKSLWAIGSEVAAEPAPLPAPSGTELVVGVADNSANGPVQPACASSGASATGYGVTAGTVGGTGSTSLNHAGIKPYGVIACSAEAPVLASGGGAGIGVLEEEGSGVSGLSGGPWTVDYRPFVATATGGSFGAAVELQDITNVSLDGGLAFDASEDNQTGVYASWVDKQGLVLDYSATSGSEWSGISPQKALSNGGTQLDPVIAGVGDGIGEVAYDANLGQGYQVFAETVDFLPPTPTALTTKQTAGLTTGGDITINAGTVGETDQATISGTNAPNAGGKVTYNLYSTSSCKASSKVASGGVKTVSAGKAAGSSPITKSLAAGTYYWKDSYSGDTTNQPSTSACGSEKLAVAPVSVIGSGTTTGTTLTFTISCSAACQVIVTVELPAGSATRAGEKKSKKAIKLASGKFKLSKRGKDKLKLDWNKYAHSLVKKDHDKLTTTLLLTTKVSKHTFKTASKLKVRK
jgi:hypothetical protein